MIQIPEAFAVTIPYTLASRLMLNLREAYFTPNNQGISGVTHSHVGVRSIAFRHTDGQTRTDSETIMSRSLGTLSREWGCKEFDAHELGHMIAEGNGYDDPDLPMELEDSTTDIPLA